MFNRQLVPGDRTSALHQSYARGAAKTVASVVRYVRMGLMPLIAPVARVLPTDRG